jgi:kynurenine formamidase
MSRFSLVILAAVCSTACTTAPAPTREAAPPFPAGAVIDLSHAYGGDTVFWPTADPFKLDVVASGVTPGGFYYAANKFSTSEHGGTHLDAPIHFAEGRHTVDQIPLDRLIGPAIVVDVTKSAEADADYLIGTADLEAFERAHGRIPDDTVVLFRTGYSARWPDAARYLGTAERGAAAVAKLHFPGLDPAAARFLVQQRKVRAVGIDTASIDRGQSTTFETHQILAAANVPGFENLTALERLPPAGAHVVALPMKIRGGTGGPLRAIAILPTAR